MVSVLASDGSVHGIATFNDVYKVLCDGAIDATGPSGRVESAAGGMGSTGDKGQNQSAETDSLIHYIDDVSRVREIIRDCAPLCLCVCLRCIVAAHTLDMLRSRSRPPIASL